MQVVVCAGLTVVWHTIIIWDTCTWFYTTDVSYILIITLYILPLILSFIHVDFEKAFDKVWREGLFYKMMLNNINGKMYNVIINMYDTSVV
jgi:hypothetical protein